MENQNNQGENCEPVKIVDQKTGLQRLVYLCAEPFQKRWHFYQRHKLHLFTDLGLLATVIILLGVIGTLWFFNAYKHTNLVDFKVTNAAELVNGQPAHFTISYANNSKKLLADAEVIIRFPKGLTDVKVSDPRFNAQNNTVFLGPLAPKMNDKIEIDGTLFSDLGTTETFLFVLNYTNDLKQPQQEVASENFKVEKSAVEMSLIIPSKIIAGSSFPATIKLDNKSDRTFDGLKLKLFFPGKYNVPEDLLKVDSLEGGKSLEKKIETVVDGSPVKDAIFTANLMITINGTDRILNSAQVKESLELSRVVVSFVKTENNKAIKPGEQTTTTLQIENNESYPVKNIKLDYKISGDFVDKTYLEKIFKGSFTDGLLTKGTIGDLNPGESKEVELTLAALPSIFVTEKNTQAQDITVSSLISYQQGDAAEEVHLTSRPLAIPVASFLKLKSAAAFYAKNGDQIGVGTLPPRPGEYTAYWAILTLTNGTNKLRNVKVTAEIAPGAEYAEVYNVTDGSPIRMLADGKTLEWYIDELSAYTGILGASAEARIQIALVPADSDVGKTPTLLTKIKITGIDDRIAEQLTASATDVTTIVSKDESLNRVAR